MPSSGQTTAHLELPVLIHRLNSPVELLTQRLREEALDWNVKLLAENDSEARIDVILRRC